MNDLLKSFSHALRGIAVAVASERNLKVQLVIAAVVIGLGFYFRIATIDWIIVMLTIASVICLELVNTALENMVNLVTKKRNPLAGKIKDIAAGAVLSASVFAIIVGILVFRKYWV